MTIKTFSINVQLELEKTRTQIIDFWPNAGHFGDDEGFFQFFYSENKVGTGRTWQFVYVYLVFFSNL